MNSTIRLDTRETLHQRNKTQSCVARYTVLSELRGGVAQPAGAVDPAVSGRVLGVHKRRRFYGKRSVTDMEKGYVGLRLLDRSGMHGADEREYDTRRG